MINASGLQSKQWPVYQLPPFTCELKHRSIGHVGVQVVTALISKFTLQAARLRPNTRTGIPLARAEGGLLTSCGSLLTTFVHFEAIAQIRHHA